MDISGEYRLALGRQDAWRALMDPEVLRRCIPGCEELEQIEADRYRARVRLVIGPVKATFHVDLRIVEANPPESYRLEGDVDFAAVSQKAEAITPVPGGVGPMTIAMLLVNTLKAAGISVEAAGFSIHRNPGE